MNKEWKTKWIEALRSGKYKQGVGLLRNSYDQYCCLGVLCDLIDSEKWRKLPNSYYEYLSFTKTFPLKLLEELNILKYKHDNLIDMNDSGDDFNKIADYIEEYL